MTMKLLSAPPRVAGPPRPHVLYLVTAAATVPLMRGQLRAMREAGFAVTVASGPGDTLEEMAAREGVAFAAVPMVREISPLRDLRSLWCLWRLLRWLRPTVLNAGTTKAGLLGGAAGWLARVPCRLYTLHGLRLETTRGLRRWLLTRTERLACRCAHRVICVSPSVRARAVALRLTAPERTVVFGKGSFNGVDADRFAPTPERRARARELRRELGLPAEAPVIGFVGRLVRDKGVPELVAAFTALRERLPGVKLLLLGRFENGDPVPPAVRHFLETDPDALHLGHVPDPSPYFHVMDVLALPTYREGYPTVVLEAAAAGLPVVSTFATGCIDAVVDGVTGLLVPVGEAPALAAALERVLTEPDLAARLGAAGRERVLRDFRCERIWRDAASLYRQLLRDRAPQAEADLGDQAAVTGRWRPAHLAVKRLADFAAALAGLALAAPVMAAAAVAIRLTMGAPVLFRQRRAGRYGRGFTVTKFRTMREARDEGGRLLPDAERLTRLGRFLRHFSIDELPQLWNVLKGEMSLVGPRPLLPEYLPLYTDREKLRHAVRPGLTGCAQVNGRHTLPFSKRLALDSWYVEHWSLWLDLKIALLTLPRALASRELRVCQEADEVDDRGLWRQLTDIRPGRGAAA
jgi:lipopolysaccharide/colanic/teichoic acid biosynthesis glycosyltransferase/glycosyltransferase involved in cell wall biosynthesis